MVGIGLSFKKSGLDLDRKLISPTKSTKIISPTI